MNEEQRNAKKRHASEAKPSMKRRDDYNDYSGRRMYMLTLEVDGRQPLLGVLRSGAQAGGRSGERGEGTTAPRTPKAASSLARTALWGRSSTRACGCIA